METKLTKLDLASWGGFIMFATSSVITPICLPEISKTFATTLAEGGSMETARTFAILIMIVLAGLGAQKWGKKRFITSGQYLFAAGLLLISLTHSYPLLIFALMLVGIGGGFSEALINPLVVDLHPQDSGKYLNLTNAFYSIGVMAAALLFGELLTLGYSWRWIFRLAAGGALIVGLSFHVARFPIAADQTHAPWVIMGTILKLPGFWLFAAAMFLGAGVESAFTFWSRTYVETYLKNIPRAGAIAVVLFAGMMAAGRLLAAHLSRNLRLKRLLIGSALLGVMVSGLLVWTATLAWFYALLALAGLATACFWPTILAEAANCLHVDATILFVMLACVGMAGFGFTPWLMGLIGDQIDLRAGFSIIPGYFVLLIVILGIEWHISAKNRHLQ
jgi:fucose permease